LPTKPPTPSRIATGPPSSRRISRDRGRVLPAPTSCSRSPSGGRHTARRAESPRHSNCRNPVYYSHSHLYTGPSTVRQNWLNSILSNNNNNNNNHNNHLSQHHHKQKQQQQQQIQQHSTTDSEGSSSSSYSAKSGISRAISVGGINTRQEKYFSARDTGKLCISLMK